MGMEKRKHRLKVLDTNFTYIKFYQDSPEEHDSSTPVSSQPLTAECSSISWNAKIFNFLVYITFFFIHRISESR